MRLDDFEKQLVVRNLQEHFMLMQKQQMLDSLQTEETLDHLANKEKSEKNSLFTNELIDENPDLKQALVSKTESAHLQQPKQAETQSWLDWFHLLEEH